MGKKRGIILMAWLSMIFRLYGQEPAYNLEFTENKGQWDSSIRYKADIPNGAFFLNKTGFTVWLQSSADLEKMAERMHGLGKLHPAARTSAGQTAIPSDSGPEKEILLHSHVYRVRFLGASDQAEIIADKPLASYNNYFLGADSTKWAGHCRIYLGITYKNIYPHIDARYYTSQGLLKYDLIVHPGGDPGQIALKYEGMERISIHHNELQIQTSVGTVRESGPATYQLNSEGRKSLECRYYLAGDNTIRFRVNNRDPESTMVIDPSLIFSTFSGSHSNNWGFTATYGPDGSFYSGGIVQGNQFLVSPGAYQTNFAGALWDVGIMKFSTDGSKKLYATYLGGSGNDYPHSMVVDAQGELVVFGRTSSGSSFPARTVVGPGGGRDIFVTKFNAGGTALVGSLRIGGTGDDGLNIADQAESENEHTLSLIQNYGDWSRGEVILDGGGNIYVASCTQSSDTHGNGFPIIGNVFQPNFGGGKKDAGSLGQDGVILKINPSCSTVLFSSFIGGSNDDCALVLDISPATGDIYVGGATYSVNMPGTSPSVLQSANAGGIDGFLSVISPDGSTLRYTTYLGTTADDMIYGVKFDKLGFPYVMGSTKGSWPVLGVTSAISPGAKQFVAKLQPNLSAYIYSTTFGRPNSATPNISPVAFLVDRCENVYVSGWGSYYSLIQPDPYFLEGTLGMPVTPDAYQGTTDNRDFYFIVLKKDANSILYGTFFGEKDDASSISEHVDGGTSRYDKSGVIYEAICANCGNKLKFPTTPGVWAPNNGSQGCNMAAIKIAFNFAGVEASPQSVIHGIAGDSTGCIPLTVTLEDLKKNAKSYIWTFGDGSPDSATTAFQLTHVYSQPGTYLVRLIAIDSTTCNIRDTAYLHIIARADKAPLSFQSLKLPPCQSLSYQFTNTSVPPAGKPFTGSSFVWDFGDGTTLASGPGTVTHSYSAPGSYVVSLLLVDTNYCNFPDSALQTLSVAALVKARFLTPATGCAPYTAYFTNSSVGGQQFSWDFGDGGTSTDINPVHLYPNPGTYTIHLTVVDSNTCNIVSDTSESILVSPKPQAAFTSSPVPPVANTRTVFYNGSTGAVSYKWLFGDGDSTLKNNMDTVQHQYNSTGTFQACLVAYNEYQCADTVCQPVQTLIHPLLDVPNAFTPGRFGVDAIVKVRGYGIAKLTFRIYNRWGQKVYEGSNPNQGWDGNYLGVPQPMDVYAYIVEAEFVDGTRANKKGDITLLR